MQPRRDKHLHIRLTKEEMELIKQAAAIADKRLEVWAREVLVQAVQGKESR